jgi:methylmalonyl-CoA mutase, C-terminal domain
MEVIYLGIRRSPKVIAEAAIQEDVDVIGISILSGAHLELTRELAETLESYDVEIPIVIGGIIPEEDVAPLYELGVVEVLGPGTTLHGAVDAIGRAAHSGRVPIEGLESA